MNQAVTVLTLIIALFAAPAAAYVGPGAGLTMLGALWGVIVAIVLSLGAILYLPIRVALKKWGRKKTQVQDSSHQDADDT